MIRIAILFSIIFLDSVRSLTISKPSCENQEICNTPGCVKAAYSLIKNMDLSVDPCEDFYQYACGGFEERVRIVLHNVR